jgi:hypothetical protein
MDNGSMHNKRVRTNFDPLRTGMQINTLIQVNASTEFDIIAHTQAHPILDRCQAIHTQNQSVEDSAYADTNNRGYPAKKCKEHLFK